MLVSGYICVCMYVWLCSAWLTSHHWSFHLYLDLFLIWPFLLYLWMSLLLPLSSGAKFPRSSWLVVDVVGIAYLMWIFFSFLRSFLCVSVCLSVCRSVSASPSHSVSARLSVSRYFICLFVSTSICLAISTLSVYLSLPYLSACLSISTSSVYLSLPYLSVCSFACPPYLSSLSPYLFHFPLHAQSTLFLLFSFPRLDFG